MQHGTVFVMSLVTYLRILHSEIGRNVAVEDAIEDDWQAKDDIKAGINPRLVHGGAGNSREITIIYVPNN